MSLLIPFYFLADRLGRPLDQIRALPFAEFMSWLHFHGFYEAIAKK